ncbi:hypothetical protein C8J57DRAFT_1636764 [Mycena rebaudengoi]|nr:hypothetical protein C8J57DRAFT_1636764 [Mycena rebaudengoi]
MLNIVWVMPFLPIVVGSVNSAWKLAAIFIPISFECAAGDVSLAAYIQSTLAKIESKDPNVSTLGAVMAFFYVTCILLYALLSAVLGNWVHAYLKKNKPIVGTVAAAREALKGHPWSRPLPTSHPPAPWTTPGLAQRPLVLHTARAGDGFVFECREGRVCGWSRFSLAPNRAVSVGADGAFLVDGVGLRGIQEARGVVVLGCERQISPSYRAHLGQALFMEDADTARVKVGVWNCECEARWWGVNVPPYRSPRETLRAQASVASARTTMMCRRYSPAIL